MISLFPWVRTCLSWILGGVSQCNGKRGPAARSSKANTEARLVERKVCFILDARSLGGEGGRLSKSWLPPTDSQGARAFIGGGRGYLQKQQSAVTSSWHWSSVVLISSILIVSSTVHLQFQGRFVPISLRPVLGIAAAYVMATAWSSCS